MMISAQTQKVTESVSQHSRATKSLKPNEMPRATDSSLTTTATTAAAAAAADGTEEKSVSPSSARLRTSPRSEVL